MKKIRLLEQINGVKVEQVVRDSEFSMTLKHMHPEYEIYFLIEGERYYFIENETFHIKGGTLVFVGRNEIHKTGAVVNHSYHNRMLISLASEYLNPFLRSIGLGSLEQFISKHKVFTLDEFGQIYVLDLFETIAKELQEKREGYEYIIKMKITELLLYSYRKQKDPRRMTNFILAESGKHRKVQEITAYICENFQRSISISDISAQFFISKGYLSRIFKDVTGFTVTEYTNIQKIKYSKELLENSHYNMTEISSKVGFDSITYFEKIFKKYSKISPMKYRKLYTEAKEAMEK